MCIVQIVYDAFNVPTIIQAVTFIPITKAIWISITCVQKCVLYWSWDKVFFCYKYVILS